MVLTNLVIARLDKLSRNEDVQQKLQAPDCRWDLVVCDEALKMSATVFGGETKYTRRYRFGQLLSTLTRHFLLMTATLHNGKEEDFQLFMALLDGDRFEGRFRDGVHVADVSDLMRRMVKENLLKFDGTPLFPERIAYTVPYKLSEDEARLYKEVTDYVREEFNRADAFQNGKRAGTVGFALTILQRRLASSPEAIYQSLRRRRERLESRLRELEVLHRAGQRIKKACWSKPRSPNSSLMPSEPPKSQRCQSPVAHQQSSPNPVEQRLGTRPEQSPEPVAVEMKPKRFHGTVQLDSTRVGRDASRIADEVIAHLAGQMGVEVTVTLEIEARLPNGATEQIVRTVTENSRTLKFTSQGFESE